MKTPVHNKMITAIGQGQDPVELGKRLAGQIKADLGNRKPGFAFMTVTVFQEGREKLLQTINRELGDVPLLGATSMGEFTEKETTKQAVALSVFPASENYHFHVAGAAGLQEDPDACVKNIMDSLPRLPKGFPHRSVFWIHDGVCGRSEELMLAATRAFGMDVIFAGGAAAMPIYLQPTDPGFKGYVFCNDRVFSNGVAVCIIDSKRPMAVGIKHGYMPISDEFTITKMHGNVVLEINGQPAWKAWEKALTEPARKAGLTVEQLATTPGGLTVFPIGLDTGKGYRLRIPLVRAEGGAVVFPTTLFEGAKIRFMAFTHESAIAAAGEATRLAKEQLGQAPVAGAFVFDCCVRANNLREHYPEGIDTIRKAIPGTPMIGFETCGETCRQQDQICSHHNATTVVMLLAE